MALDDLAPLDGFFQHGYVTNDLDRALTYFRKLGMRDFLQMRSIETQVMGDEFQTISLALGNFGHLQIEVIQPEGGDCTVYTELLPASGFALKLHHHGFMTFDERTYEALRDSYAADGAPIVIDGCNPKSGNRYCYADTRVQLGHYIEYIFASETGRHFYDTIPQNAAT